MTEILSLWRSPLDQVALFASEVLSDRQPCCSIAAGEDFSAMTIYNFAYYYLPLSPPNTGTALTEMFSAMNPGPYATGGLAFVPQLPYATVQASAAGFSVPDQCNIVGSGGGGSGGTPYYHFTVDFTSGSLFFSCSSTNYTSGGTYFRSLAFKGINVSVGDTCIDAVTNNCRAYNCTFTDIPTAFYAQGNGCALEQCTIAYYQVKGTKAVVISGAQCGIFGPGEIFQGAGNNPPKCTGISIEGAEHTVIANVHISDWNIGVDFSQVPGAQYTQVTNCEAQCWQSALNIQLPMSVDETTTGIKITSCMLSKSTTTTESTPAVLVDPQNNLNAQLSDITLIDCTVFSYAASSGAQHGLQIIGGSNIKIIGGTYSNNGSGGGAGIAITGACGDVQIIGANLQPTYLWAPNTNYQSYGLLVSGGPTGTVYVSGCDLTGYTMSGQHAVEVTGTPPQELLIYNCPGYNDLSTPLNGGVPPTSSTNAANCTTPYFGPSVFIFSNSSVVTLQVFGQNISMSFGIIFLPSPYDNFHFTTTPTMFSWLGK